MRVVLFVSIPGKFAGEKLHWQAAKTKIGRNRPLKTLRGGVRGRNIERGISSERAALFKTRKFRRGWRVIFLKIFVAHSVFFATFPRS
jgi:hypothetical protein